MQWESLGFKGNPFSTDPIVQSTLPLYAGRRKIVKTCNSILQEKSILLVIEGARGVGTTSFANYLRFSAQERREHFTPNNEIRVGPGWSLETLLAAIIANVVREIELSLSNKTIKEKAFQDAKALSMRIADTYRSFGIEAFGFGVNYGKSAGIASQPIIVPSAVLGHHLEDLGKLVQIAGYKYGILLQLNNLDVGEIHEGNHLKYLFNELRDYIQTDNISWLFVGDIGLRRFIAQHVDRLDDIISYDITIESLTKAEYQELINKRIDFYKNHERAKLPIDNEVFLYLLDLTKGRLRYVFGLIKRLLNELFVGDLVDRLTLDIVKPMVIKLAKERLTKHSLTSGEEEILSVLVKMKDSTATDLSKHLNKTRQQVSKILVKLAEIKLLEVKQQGIYRIYVPTLDAIIAYSSK